MMYIVYDNDDDYNIVIIAMVWLVVPHIQAPGSAFTHTNPHITADTKTLAWLLGV